ncbi:MAG: iron-containing alcohol dehydrogenase family protein [Acidimicrobiales bacterium]
MLHRWVHTSIAQQVVVGPGAVTTIGEVLTMLGMRRVLLVTTRGRAGSDGGDRVRAAIGRGLADTFDEVVADVPTTAVQAAVANLRGEAFDGLVSFGGGAAVDTAKALAFFHEHESGTPAAGFADRPVLPHVAIPTTLAGAAFSTTFSMVDPQSRRSTTAGAPTMVPSAVLVDPELGADLSSELLLGSIATAVAHGVEALWTPDRTPEAEALASAGLGRLAVAAPDAMAEPGDIERRAALVDGAVLCGRARQNAGDGLHHVLVQLVAARAQVPHGPVHAALLPATTGFTTDVVPDAAAAISRALGHTGEPDDAGGAVSALLERLGPVQGLSDLGVGEDDLEAVARQAGSHRGVQVHPRPAGEADITALLEDAW